MREDVKNLKEPDISSPEYGSLVISLRKGDEIIIGDMMIIYLGRRKNQAILRISAKKDVPIKRIHHKNIKP